MERQPVDLIQLQWEEEDQKRSYVLTGRQRDGQWTILGTWDQGPFDTALEAAQWAWRTLAKWLPPSRC